MFGESGNPPESYWRPWLGEACHLRPCDLGDLTPEQMLDCGRWAEARGVVRFGG